MKLRTGDFFIAFLVILLAAVIWIYPLMGDEGELCRITVGGKVFEEIPLTENKKIDLSGCTVEVKDGKVSVKDSDCPDKVCEKTGKISKSGESIVCVPNRISIEISGEKKNDVIAG